MKIKSTRIGIILLACFTLFTVLPGFVPPAQAQTYFLDSLEQQSGIPQSGPPMPYDPYGGAETITTLDATRQIFEIKDDTNAYALLCAAMQLDAMSASTTSADSIDPTGGTGDTNSTGGDYTNSFQPLVFGPNDLVIQITNVDIVNQQCSLFLTNTIADNHYQLLYTNTLGTNNGVSWTLGEIITGAFGTNITPFDAFNIGTNSQMFFRAHHSDNEIYVSAGQNAIEPDPGTGDPGQVGQFNIFSVFPLTNDLTVQYAMSGTAQPGVDYTSPSGVAVIPADQGYTTVDITPLHDSAIDGAETLTMTLAQSNSYLIDPNNSASTILVEDSSLHVSVSPSGDAVEANGPPGMAAQAGHFTFTVSDERNIPPQTTIYFTLSGTASNGVDYQFISNSIVVPAGQGYAYLDVNPLSKGIFDDTETVTLTLVPTNTYLVNTNYGANTATVNIYDSSTTVSVAGVQDAIETNAETGTGQPGIFAVHRADWLGNYPPMTVYYEISGTATNGVDYQPLSGTITFADGAQDTNIYINTIEQDLIEPDETVTLTIVPNGNAYYPASSNTYYPGNSSATIVIHNPVASFTVAKNLNGPVGIDYYMPSNSLVISYNYNSQGNPFNFAQLETNILVLTNGTVLTNAIVTNWSGVNGQYEEIYFVAPRIAAGLLTNSARFTNGDLFFGTDRGTIGWLSAGATRSNMNWCVLTNSTQTNATPLRGGMCLDQTGTFSNQLIAVTSPGVAAPGGGVPEYIWRVDSHAIPILIGQITCLHLEGVTTLTNDVQRWGPWAGKIITGDEDQDYIFAMDANGNASTYDTRTITANGIAPEDFQVIPPNSALYFTAVNNNTVMEIPAAYFRYNVGDLLVAQAGEVSTSTMFIIHWNAQTTNFMATPIGIPVPYVEHVTFAPVEFTPAP